MLTANDIEKVKDFALERSVIVAIYVFGSAATGRDRPGSDIDLAIMVRGSLSGMERVEMETALSNLLHRDVDLVVFGRATPLLQHQVLKYGRLIHEVDVRERVRQEVLARSHYLDGAFLYRKLGKGNTHGG
jgi:predicted nucleotidyltransferase